MTVPPEAIDAAEEAFEWIEDDWDAFRSRHFAHHSATMQPASTTAPEAAMSLITEVKTGLHAAVTKLEQLDEDAVTKLEAIQANPGAVEVMNALAAVLHVPANGLSLAVNVLEDLGKLWEPEQAQAAPPA